MITGYLGSGKTTVLNELLKSQTGERLAIIVNDLGSINIDASLTKKKQCLRSRDEDDRDDERMHMLHVAGSIHGTDREAL